MSVTSHLADRCLRAIEPHRKWVLTWKVANPDWKRPSSSSGSSRHSTERFAYDAVMDILEERGIIGEESDLDESKLLSTVQKKHMANWNSTEIVRHTLESAQAITEMANNRVFDSIVYKESYMDMKAFSFKIREEPFVFCLSYQHQGNMSLEQAKNVEEIRSICEEIEDCCEVTDVQWKWTTLRYATTSKNQSSDDDDSECDETDMEEPADDTDSKGDEEDGEEQNADDGEPEQLEIQPPRRKRTAATVTTTVLQQSPVHKRARLV